MRRTTTVDDRKKDGKTNWAEMEAWVQDTFFVVVIVWLVVFILRQNEHNFGAWRSFFLLEFVIFLYYYLVSVLHNNSAAMKWSMNKTNKLYSGNLAIFSDVRSM